jgi:hypothetical protein
MIPHFYGVHAPSPQRPAIPELDFERIAAASPSWGNMEANNERMAGRSGSTPLVGVWRGRKV